MARSTTHTSSPSSDVIHVVTDSTSDITRDQAEKLGIAVVPLTVRFGDELFLDGIELTADQFYKRLGRAQPSTSQPSPERFAEVYRERLNAPDDVVISVHISPRLSGTVQSAHLAAQDFPGGAIRVVDSGTVSGGIQLLIRRALADVAADKDADSVVEGLETRRRRLGVYVALETITYLQRGGRIGRAQALIGGVLHLRPVIACNDGEITPERRVRSQRQAVEALGSMVIDQGPLEDLCAFHSGAEEMLRTFRDMMAKAHPQLEMSEGRLGPVVGTYSGPGALGVAYLRAG